MSNELQILEFRPFRRKDGKPGALFGFATILIPILQLKVRGIKCFQKPGGEQWFKFPEEEFKNDKDERCWNPWMSIENNTYYVAFQSSMRNKIAEYLRDNPMDYD